MNIESLKEQARRHEQKEEWPKALDLYKKAISRLKEEDQPDIALFNRAGDIQSRIGDLEGAVKHYERAVELYLEAELPNNAIAICKKVLRNLPARATAYLRMGQIRASQGFLTDARQNFLAYAELMQEAGEMEEAFRALIEFTNLAPHDMDIREGVAAQLASHGSTAEAVEQLTVIYRHRMQEGKEEAAAQIRDRILKLDPDAVIPTDFTAPATEPADDDLGLESTSLGAGAALEEDEAPEYELGEIEFGGEEADPEGAEAEEVDASAPLGIGADSEFELETDSEFELETDSGLELETDSGLEISGEFTLETDGADEGDEEDIGLDLPLMDFDSDPDSEPGIAGGMDEEDEEGDVDFDLPLMDLDDAGDADAGEETDPLPVMDLELPGEGVDDEEREIGETGDIEEEAGILAEADGALEAGWEDVSFDAGAEDEGSAGGEPDPHEAARARGAKLLKGGDRAGGLRALHQAHRGLARDGKVEQAIAVMREVIRHDPGDPGHHQTLVEYAHRIDDRDLHIQAFLDLAECLVRGGQKNKARAVYRQVLEVDPKNAAADAGMAAVAPAPPATPATPATPAAPVGGGGGGDFLDLGSMVLDEGGERTTRWTISAEAPSGDEEADFKRLLSQFKAKVAENVSGDDFKAHYDLGTAYKEMGLLDEAIGEFQQALRASGGNLATYEMLGQCFMDGGQPEVAVRTLLKALDMPYEVEEELLGIYYHLARGFEAVNDRKQALDYYEKVFALDINFMDATERLRALRT